MLMDSNTSRVKIHVRLQDEGTEVCRPTEALDLGNGFFKILPTKRYDPQDEKWEFPPGSVVRGKSIGDADGAYLLAVNPEGQR
jgi:hypothetical protein